MDAVYSRVNDFIQVMRRHVCGITGRNACRAVDQHNGKRNRQNGRLIFRIVKIRCHLDSILVEVSDEFLANGSQTGFGVTISRGTIAVDGTVVTLEVD